jgi:hypothetical protein
MEVAANELVAPHEQTLRQGCQGLACGHSRPHLTLPMTCGDSADYLGLTIETVSRRNRAVEPRPAGAGKPGRRTDLKPKSEKSARGRTRTGKEFPPGVFETPAVTISPLAHREGLVAATYAIGATGRNRLGTKLDASVNGAPFGTVQPA